jgi:hypothetical protein
LIAPGIKRWRIPVSVWIFWLMAAIAVPVWVAHDSSAWDLRVYGKALDSLHAGHDPYTDATNVQKQHHAELAAHKQLGKDQTPPYSYVYSPITLPLLRALGHLQSPLLIGLYWTMYVAGALGAIAVSVVLASASEFPAVLFIAGVAVFFPGLLANGTILSGNIAYILYGLILGTALLAWRRGIWWPFYVAVMFASCVKAPLLSLTLIAPLSGRRQWLPSFGVMVAGTAIFAMQPVLWPALFRHYLEAIELQFSFNHDFGCSPAGLFSNTLFTHGISYSPASYFFYLAYALPVFASLLVLSRRFFRGSFSLEQWVPVLLTGIILLNPRIMEYDVAPVTVSMALIAWRSMSGSRNSRTLLWTSAALFVVLNAAALFSWEWRKVLDGPLLSLLFAAGCWQLWRQSQDTQKIEALHPKMERLVSM